MKAWPTRTRGCRYIAQGHRCTSDWWVAAQQGVSSVILGANRLEQLRENLAALTIEITPELDQELQELFPVPQPE